MSSESGLRNASKMGTSKKKEAADKASQKASDNKLFQLPNVPVEDLRVNETIDGKQFAQAYRQVMATFRSDAVPTYETIRVTAWHYDNAKKFEDLVNTILPCVGYDQKRAEGYVSDVVNHCSSALKAKQYQRLNALTGSSKTEANHILVNHDDHVVEVSDVLLLLRGLLTHAPISSCALVKTMCDLMKLDPKWLLESKANQLSLQKVPYQDLTRLIRGYGLGAVSLFDNIFCGNFTKAVLKICGDVGGFFDRVKKSGPKEREIDQLALTILLAAISSDVQLLNGRVLLDIILYMYFQCEEGMIKALNEKVLESYDGEASKIVDKLIKRSRMPSNDSFSSFDFSREVHATAMRPTIVIQPQSFNLASDRGCKIFLNLVACLEHLNSDVLLLVGDSFFAARDVFVQGDGVIRFHNLYFDRHPIKLTAGRASEESAVGLGLEYDVPDIASYLRDSGDDIVNITNCFGDQRLREILSVVSSDHSIGRIVVWAARSYNNIVFDGNVSNKNGLLAVDLTEDFVNSFYHINYKHFSEMSADGWVSDSEQGQLLKLLLEEFNNE